MSKRFLYLASCLGAWVLAVLPLTSQAFTVESDITSDDATDVVTDVSDVIPIESHGDIVEAIAAFSYTAETGSTTYTAIFTVTDDADELDAAPFVMGAGTNVSSLTVESLSDEVYQYTITFTTGDMYMPAEAPDQLFIVVFIGTAENPSLENPEPGNGPPAAMSGGYIATTVLDFQIVPPSGPEDAAFGVILNGPAGTSGFFKMKFPASMLELMGTMAGKTMTADDLAVFVDNDQATTSVVETDDGGVLMDIQVTFAEGSTNVQGISPHASTVSKEIVAKEQLPLSSAFLKSSVRRGKQATFYGWRKAKAISKNVKIYRKKAGASKYTLVDTVEVDESGYYEYNFKAKKLQLKNGTYQFKAVSGGVTSPKQSLEITK